MKRLIALFVAVIAWAATAQTSQTMTSPNLMDPVSQQVSITGSVPVPGTFGGGGVSGGYQPAYNATTNTVIFGYVSGTVAYRYAFSQALQNSGISILGYNYAWQYYNQDYSRGTANATVSVDAPNGTLLHSKSWNLPQTTEGWTNMSGTETFVKGLPTSNIAGVSLSFTGNDDRWWAGWWGPQVRNASLSLNYTFDQCSVNPLSDPSCPGYTQAYHDQQCSINPLYAADCPGYYQAYLTQQCSANPMFSVSCPGYALAYHDQQCALNALYMSDCPGYQEAYNRKMAADTAIKQSTVTTTTTTVVTAVTTAPDTTSPTSPTSVVGPVSVINPPVPAAGVQSAISSVSVETKPSTETQQQRATEQKRTEGQVARAARGNVAAAARDAAERAQNARSMEDQAATQGLVVGLMGYVPGFAAYQNVTVPDALAQAVARQYMKPTVDNRAAQRALSGASDSLHRQMVEQQYK